MSDPPPLTKEQRAILEHQVRDVINELLLKERAGRGDDGSGNGVDLGYKGMRATIRGPLGVLAAVFLVIGSGLVYVNYKGFEDVKHLLVQSSSDHDLLSCVVSLSLTEREQLRRVTARESFSNLCPWLRPR